MTILTPQFSLGSWAFSFGPFANDPWSFEKVCRYAASANYDGIEINGFRPHPHPDDYTSDSQCRKLHHFLDELNLGISAYAPDFTQVPPAKLDSKVYIEQLRKALSFCDRMGIEILRVDTVSSPEELNFSCYQQQFEQLVATWQKSAQLCQSYGVTLVWEFEPGFWLNKPSEVVALVEAVNHSHFKILFDSSHAYMGAVVGARHSGEREIVPGGVAVYAQRLMPYIGHLHFIDSNGQLHNGETSVHAPFGTGLIDFENLIEVLTPKLSTLSWCCMDFCFCPTTENDAKAAIPFIKKLLKAANRES